MRKILLCADIHGNFQALQALMKTKCAKTADEIYVLGDLVCMGPQPNEVIDFIKDNPKIQAIMGNHDKWVAVEPPPSSINAKRIKVKHHEYMTAVITDENLEYLRNLPYYKIIEFHGKKFYLTHYGWKDNFTEVMPHPDTIENKDIVLVANLPYIPTKTFEDNAPDNVQKWEPKVAFVWGDDGLDLYRAMFRQLEELTKNVKWLTMFLEMMTWQIDILREEFWAIMDFEEVKTFHFNIRIVKAQFKK